MRKYIEIKKEQLDEIFFTKIAKYNNEYDYESKVVILDKDSAMLIFWRKNVWNYKVYQIDSK